ncbi:ketopantoate reductase family protein [Desulforhopalus sp. 52FAK]
MKIVIVGGGAIGRLFGSYLANNSNEVTLLDIDHHIVRAIKNNGIHVLGRDVTDPDMVSRVRVNAVTDGKRITESDLVLLMVKSFSTRAASQSIAHLIGPGCPLLSIQTGLGNIEIIEQAVSKNDILRGFTFMSGTALGDSKVRYGQEGKTYIGEIDGERTSRVQKIADLFEKSGISTQVVKRIIGRLWCKVIVFSAINPLSALLKVPNGVLTSKMESITLMKRLLDEGKAVADAHGIDLVYNDLYELLFDACQRSSNNLSSMFQDILNSNLTEIDAQNGAICKYAAMYGVATPTHQTMLEMIKLQEKWSVIMG